MCEADSRGDVAGAVRTYGHLSSSPTSVLDRRDWIICSEDLEYVDLMNGVDKVSIKANCKNHHVFAARPLRHVPRCRPTGDLELWERIDQVVSLLKAALDKRTGEMAAAQSRCRPERPNSSEPSAKRSRDHTYVPPPLPLPQPINLPHASQLPPGPRDSSESAVAHHPPPPPGTGVPSPLAASPAAASQPAASLPAASLPAASALPSPSA